MIKSSELDQISLDELLRWLDRDRDKAGQKYEQIRRSLIKFFTGRGCRCPEDLADETLSRVAHKAAGLATTYQGDPSFYFYGVAKNVHREYLRMLARESGSEVQEVQDKSELVEWSSHRSEIDEFKETRVQCLSKCLRTLPDEQRHLVVSYYENETNKKIANRKSLAERRQMSVNALRLQAHRLRQSLRKCVGQCMNPRARHEYSVRLICI